MSDGTISCEMSSVVTVRSVNGFVFARLCSIIPNTTTEDAEGLDYVLEEDVVLPTTLKKPIMMNGEEAIDVQWSEPVKYNEIKDMM